MWNGFKQEVTTYRQYNMRRGDNYTFGWLDNANLRVGTRVKLDDGEWWTITSIGDHIRQEKPEELRGCFF